VFAWLLRLPHYSARVPPVLKHRRALLGAVLGLVALTLVVALVALLRGLGLRHAAMATALAAGMIFVFAGVLQRSAERTQRLLAGARAAPAEASRQPLALIVVGALLLLLGLALRLS
jgi:hypothetical protein